VDQVVTGMVGMLSHGVTFINPPGASTMSVVVNHPILGIGVIRAYGSAERFSFDFKTFEVFMCDDELGTFRQAILAVSISTREEAEQILATIQGQPEFKGMKLFVVEVTRKAILGNFAPSLIKRRQQPDMLP
jgi:hypothetical protein